MKLNINNLIRFAPFICRKAARRGALLTLGLSVIAQAQGETFTWSGHEGSDGIGNWTEPGNWVGGVLPPFDGSADILLPTPLAESGVVAGTTVGMVYDIRSLTVASM